MTFSTVDGALMTSSTVQGACQGACPMTSAALSTTDRSSGYLLASDRAKRAMGDPVDVHKQVDGDVGDVGDVTRHDSDWQTPGVFQKKNPSAIQVMGAVGVRVSMRDFYDARLGNVSASW